MERKPITNIEDIKRFLFGGKAHFSLVSKSTGKRFTFKVQKAKNGSVYFVSVMYGRDNNSDYAYIGYIVNSNNYVHGTRKSKIGVDDIRNKAFTWFFNALMANQKLEQIEFWHEGRCGCCGRRLTVPNSIEIGIGPECLKRYG